MNRVLSCKQMRDADLFTIETLGILSSELVERAGTAVAEEIFSRFKGGRVLVCVGKGNNGEDGMVVAKLLSQKHGFSVKLFCASVDDVRIFDESFDIIVDCLFGTGLNRDISDKYKQIIELINDSCCYVISCDISSGLNADTGKPMGVAVRADLTIAIQEYKLGHFLNDGLDYSGKVVARDIGISIWGDDFAKILNNYDVKNYFDKRNRNVHKGCFGKCAILGGSKHFFGSALLSLNALAGLKMGSGYAYLIVPESLFSTYAGLNPECILLTVPDKEGYVIFDHESLKKLLDFDSIAVGMGMGVSEEVYNLIAYLLKNYYGKLIIDADGLNSIATYGTNVLKDKKSSVVLTPHVGEFCRLANVKKEDVVQNSVELAKSFASNYGVTVCLKSATSIITDGTETFINITGCSGMAKAGSGDVLSGLTCGLLARRADVVETVAVASYIFGKCGELSQEEGNEYSITASDLISSIPKVLNSL